MNHSFWRHVNLGCMYFYIIHGRELFDTGRYTVWAYVALEVVMDICSRTCIGFYKLLWPWRLLWIFIALMVVMSFCGSGSHMHVSFSVGSAPKPHVSRLPSVNEQNCATFQRVQPPPGEQELPNGKPFSIHVLL